MVAAVTLTDVSGQRRRTFPLEEDGQTSPHHRVGQVVERYRAEMIDPGDFYRDGNLWPYSRGVRLDMKTLLKDLPAEDDKWLILSEATAGAH